ncbi:unnamed protein product [[Candida] boidinii]|uniref:Unnamed protein product n=1 Tax=Candida boidinii TaxID=5477 RepID=A0A9W6T9Z0_CANBO|nr:unnamed protein product [[Candida] boidinii]
MEDSPMIPNNNAFIANPNLLTAEQQTQQMQIQMTLLHQQQLQYQQQQQLMHQQQHQQLQRVPENTQQGHHHQSQPQPQPQQSYIAQAAEMFRITPQLFGGSKVKKEDLDTNENDNKTGNSKNDSSTAMNAQSSQNNINQETDQVQQSTDSVKTKRQSSLKKLYKKTTTRRNSGSVVSTSTANIGQNYTEDKSDNLANILEVVETEEHTQPPATTTSFSDKLTSKSKAKSKSKKSEKNETGSSGNDGSKTKESTTSSAPSSYYNLNRLSFPMFHSNDKKEGENAAKALEQEDSNVIQTKNNTYKISRPIAILAGGTVLNSNMVPNNSSQTGTDISGSRKQLATVTITKSKLVDTK